MGRSLHLVGIGGSGMASLAAYLLQRGDRVSGSDAKDSAMLARLRREGATVYLGASAAHLPHELDHVVHTAAVLEQHPEIRAARERVVPVSKYATFLGAQMSERRGLGVAGSHGKTTTSGLLAHILSCAGRRPSAVVGGFPRAWNTPGRFGTGEDFVAEACEYDHSFLRLPLHSAIVTNVDADHLDYFGGFAQVVDAFQQFVQRLPSSGFLVLTESAAMQLDLGAAMTRPIVVGESDGVTDRLVRFAPQHGLERARLYIEGKDSLLLAPALPGHHNLWNAALAATLAVRIGVPAAQVENAVRDFRGMRRRLEPLEAGDGRHWYADYGHHPAEIRAVRLALRARHPDRRLVLVFQPHQVTRTRLFRDAFATELAAFDAVLIPGIFAARETKETVEQELQLLVDVMRERGLETVRVDGLSRVHDAVQTHSRPGDVVTLMGAGDIDDLAEPMRVDYQEAGVA